jgi:c-di-GMP-binding flagellar brake protein YcgR
MMQDTREHQRYNIRVSAEVTLHQGEPMTCVTRDLSLGGLGVDTEWPLPEGMPISIELFVVVDDIEDETTTPLQLAGQVVWSRKRGQRDFLAGIQFVDLTPDQTSYLQQLVAATASAVTVAG